MKRLARFGLVVAGLALLGSACSLAGDVTPPPNAETFTSANATVAAPTPTQAAAPADTGLGYPSFKPSTAGGAAVYAEHCAACHGPTGQSDGPMTPQLPAPPPRFSEPATLAGFTPFDLFTTITQGRQEKFMPPFNRLLTEEQRWNAVAFLYSLRTPAGQVDAGRALYTAQCAACHGETGAGDGPAAAGRLKGFDDQQAMAGLSQAGLLEAINNGVGQAMPAFDGALSEAERQAVADYVRTLSFDNSAPAAPVLAAGAVTGRVSNGTAGAAAPAGLEVNLHSFEDVNSVQTITTTVAADGSFQFADVPHTASQQFLITTSYQDVVYGSQAVTFAAGQNTLDLPVVVYETTADPAEVRIQQMHVFFEFNPGSVTVGEVYIFANLGDRTLWRPGGTLDFPVPAGAAELQVPQQAEGSDWVRTSDGLSVIAPVVPGQQSSQVVFTFSLPYTDRLDFTQPVLYPVDSANVLLPDVGVKLSGNLRDDGRQSIQDTAYQLFSAENIAANGTLAFQLKGRPGSAEAAAGNSSSLSAAVGIGALMAALAGIGYWLYERRLPQPAPARLPGSRDGLLQAIAELDDAFENDAVKEREYERRRAQLKARLVKLMQDE